jgi:hypothetical protein
MPFLEFAIVLSLTVLYGSAVIANCKDATEGFLAYVSRSIVTGTSRGAHRLHLNPDPLDLIHGNLIAAPVIEARGLGV